MFSYKAAATYKAGWKIRIIDVIQLQEIRSWDAPHSDPVIIIFTQLLIK